MKQTAATSQMNLWGMQRKPFFFMIDFEMADIRLYPLEDLDDDIFLKTGLFTKENSEYHKTDLVSLSPRPVNFDSYKKAFDKVLKEINFGNSFLVNLTVKTPVELSGSLLDVYYQSKSLYKLYFKDQFVVFSPETFVRIENGIISSYPMKGTIDAMIPNADQIILNDRKEKAEHNTIVDLIRNDLSMVAKKVRVDKFRYLDKIKSSSGSIYQVSSRIIGELPENYNETIGNIIITLLPAGSISGAPKKKTIEIIRDAEEEPRGYYTGVCGVFDGYSLDSFVMIRYIQKDGSDYNYRSGGGLTFMSKTRSEYEEIIQKIYVPTN
ncbi:MAG: aminodeoxychorismate synthase component I [Bacteroidia bacterium]|nr:aminodeoxychorismate synthase component I [Bacteroidia bacterium]